MFQTFTLDNSLLGPMSPWTKSLHGLMSLGQSGPWTTVRWTNVSTPSPSCIRNGLNWLLAVDTTNIS